MVPISAGISSGCGIYVGCVIWQGPRKRDADPPINQAPGDGSAAALVIGKPSYAFDLHLAGKHHPVLTENCPTNENRWATTICPGTQGIFLFGYLLI